MADFHIVSKWTFGTAIAQSHRQPKRAELQGTALRRSRPCPSDPRCRWCHSSCNMSGVFCKIPVLLMALPMVKWKRDAMDPHCGRKFCTISRCVLSNFISYCYARWSLGSCSAWQGVSLPIVIDVPIPTLDHCPFFWLSRRFFNESCRSKRSAVVLMIGHFPVVKMFIAIPLPSCIFRNMERILEIPGCQGTRYLSDL